MWFHSHTIETHFFKWIVVWQASLWLRVFRQIGNGLLYLLQSKTWHLTLCEKNLNSTRTFLSCLWFLHSPRTSPSLLHLSKVLADCWMCRPSSSARQTSACICCLSAVIKKKKKLGVILFHHRMIILFPGLLTTSPSQVTPTIFAKFPKQFFGVFIYYSRGWQ